MWALVALVLIALPFASAPGKYVFDTRDSLWFNPGTYLTRAFALWRSTPYLGVEQHDGIIVPMGIVVWAMRSLGLSIWVAERLWHGLLLFTATAGTVILVDELRGKRTLVAPFAAGLAYALTPYSVGYGLPFTPVWLPYVLLPFLLFVVVRGIDRPGLAWPAAFGLVTFLMGGGNGAPQIYVLVTATALMAWLALVQRRVSVRTAARFALWAWVFFVGMNAYWLFLLNSPEVFNALKFSEQPTAINIASSASEAIRGLGFWQFYGGDEFGSWVPTVRAYVTSPLLVLTGYAVVAGAFLSAWLVKWRYRLFFVILAIVAVFISIGIFPVGSSSPFGHVLLFLYDHVWGVAGLRTTYKVTAEINLSIAILAGVGLEHLYERVGERTRRLLPRLAVAGVAVALIAANGFPLWTGRLYNDLRSTGPIPRYWQQALAALDQRDQGSRAFFVPATSWSTSTYTWGALKEHITATDPTLNAIYPVILPVAQRYGSNLLAALQEPYLDGAPAPGTAQLLRYLGVRDVVLQNDLDWQRSRSARPAQLQLLRADPDLRPYVNFGDPGENVAVPRGKSAKIPSEASLQPVQILTVRDPVGMIRAESSDPVVVSGDGFGIAAAARHGLLDGGPPILYSGNLTREGLASLIATSHPSFIVTDSNRRRVWHFSVPLAPRSYTLARNQTIGDSPIGYLLFDDRTSTQTFVPYPGVRTISSSAYGSVFGANPQYRPANAFDGNPSTGWLVGTGSDPVGNWIQATFQKPTLLSNITIAQPDAWWLRSIRQVRVTFSDGSSVLASLLRGGRTTVQFPSRLTSSIRITLLGVSGNPLPGRLSGAALSDVQIPGLNPAEIVQVPTDLFDTASRTPQGIQELATSPFTYLFERARSYYAGGPDEEIRIARRFEVAGTRTFTLSGTVHLGSAASDSQLDKVLLGPQLVQVNSSTRVFDAPAFRGSAALDGDPSTEWVPSGAVGQWLSVRFPRHEIDRIVVDTDTRRSRITRIRAVFPDGTSVSGDLANPLSGEIELRFPPRLASAVTLFVDKVFSPATQTPPTVGIKEVHIPGVPPLRVKRSEPLPCSRTVVALDGQPVAVRPVGTEGALLTGKDLPLTTCDGSGIVIGPGGHELLAGGGLQPDVVMLSTGSPLSPPPLARLPSMSWSQRWGGGYDIAVKNAEGPYYLVVGQNYDPRWKASIDGRDLGPPIVLDGYSVGWRVSRPGSYTVSVRYGKQRLYDGALLLSAVTLALGFTFIVLGWRRRRRSAAPGV